MGAFLPHPNSFTGRDTRYSVILISPENVSEYAGGGPRGSFTELVEAAINNRLDAVAEAGGYVVHIEYGMNQTPLFLAAITVALTPEKPNGLSS
jgi:hypothetical protein